MSIEIVDTSMMQAERAGGRGNMCREDSHCHRFHKGPHPMVARYFYAILFLLANLCAWAVRENHITFFEGQRLNGCLGNKDCLAAEVVLIISLTSFLFFSIIFFSTMYKRKVNDRRNSWHSQWWTVKGVLLTGCLIISTLAPSYWTELYGKVSHFGAGCIDPSGDLELTFSYLEVIAVSIISYSGSMVGIILMTLWYTACWMNIAFIGTTLLLVYLMPLISRKSKAKGFYMEPGLVGAYSVFLCYSAIRSEPETYCYKKEKAGAGADWKTIISFVAELISIAASAFSTGKDYKCVHIRNVAESEDDVPYAYGFFHFVFAMGSMYFGMLFVSWDTHHIMEKWSMDVSWTSVWVHIANEGLAVISFMAILVARIYGIDWLRQLLAPIFGTGGQQQQSETTDGIDDDDDDGPPPPPWSQQTTEETVAGPPPSPVSQQSTNQLRQQEIPPTRSSNVDIVVDLSGGGPPAACCATAGRRRRTNATAGPHAYATAGRRVPTTAGNWIRLLLTSRRLALFLLCLHVIIFFVAFTCLDMYAHQPIQ